MIAGSIATMDATRYRKNRKHWGEPPAVVSPTQRNNIIFCNIFSPEVTPTQTSQQKPAYQLAQKHKK
jgi:hypothetical protein